MPHSNKNNHLTQIPIIQVTNDSLYESHEKIYPREVSGPFQKFRKLCVVGVLVAFYGLAWVPWQGRQAVLFDLPARQFSIFGLQFWPQDFYLLSWLLILSALVLFTVTALAGRIWCGYTCPQTVWTELFLSIERLTEGSYSQRKKLDAQPWHLKKITRKFLKQFLWISLALWTGFTFVGYFTPIKTLLDHVLALQLGGWEWFWVLFYGFATYGNAGYLREQVCKYMCPYARFQSAMLDQNSLVITYDKFRGEPRKQKQLPPSKTGDCIDCKICVQVCPTGIDIRDGLQYECIGCAACIDACDNVMRKIGKPIGLIRYSSEQALNQIHQQPQTKSPVSVTQDLLQSIFRPRMLIYLGLLAVLSIAFVSTIALRSPATLDISRDRLTFYQQTIPGFIDNIYTLKILNKTAHPQTYQLDVADQNQAILIYQPTPIEVKPLGHYEFALRVRLPENKMASGPITLKLIAIEQQTQFKATADTLFWYPKESP